MRNPILAPAAKPHSSGGYSQSELTLANRNSGTLLETLRYDVTPVGAHYLLIHFDIPTVTDADGWQLELTGKVERPLNLTLGNIIELATQQNLIKTQRVTLECAGNGRANVEPRWPSQPWQVEAVGTADWCGMPLKHLLDQASPTAQAREVVFHAADEGVDGGKVHHFARSLCIDDAIHQDVMLAWQMNDQPLLPQHGFPLRLIVPGWYGMASVKWLNKIEVIDHAFTGHQQTGTYIYRTNENDAGTPVTGIKVKSLLVPPGLPDWRSRKRLVRPGSVQLIGRAWSGNGLPIVNVEWSCNDNWHSAELKKSPNKYSWSQWTAHWQATPGKHLLSCRATDAGGNTQPLKPVWDQAGFGNNSVHQVEVWCEDF